MGFHVKLQPFLAQERNAQWDLKGLMSGDISPASTTDNWFQQVGQLVEKWVHLPLIRATIRKPGLLA